MSSKTYTKKDISKKVASNLDMHVNDIHLIISNTFNVMREMLSETDSNVRIEVRNFGVLSVKPTKAKPRARNPRTNEEIYVPPHRKTHFKPGKMLKDVLKQPL